MNNEIDLDAVLDCESSLKSGVYGLWLRVFTMSFFELQNGRWPAGAESFLFDPENPFFDFVADGLGYESDNLRNRIRGALAWAEEVKIET